MSDSRNKLTNIIDPVLSIKNKTLHFNHQGKLCTRSNSQGNIIQPSQILGVSEGLITCLPQMQSFKQPIEPFSTIQINSNSNSNSNTNRTIKKHKRLISASQISNAQLEKQFNSNTNIFKDNDNDLNNDYLAQYEHHLRCVNEIKKLNRWDIIHAHRLTTAKGKGSSSPYTARGPNSYRNTLNNSALKYMLDLKNTKYAHLFSRNQNIQNVVNNIDTEQITLVKQNINVNKNTINIEMLSGGKLQSEKKVDNINYTQVEYYKKVMKEKMKIEEMIRNDLIALSEELYNKTDAKKKLILDKQKIFQSITGINDDISKLKRNDTKVKTKLNQIMNKEIKQTTELKNISQKKRSSLIFTKTVTLMSKNLSNTEEFNQKLSILTKGKNKIIALYEAASKELIDLDEEIRQLKLKVSTCIIELQKYYIEILKKGIDVRSKGLSWVIVNLIQLKTFLEKSDFPQNLNEDQIEYLMTISYLQYELNELIQLFKILKAKQKKMKEQHDEALPNSIGNSQSMPRLLARVVRNSNEEDIPKNSGRLEELFNELEVISKKYEKISQKALDSYQEEIYINNIIGTLKEEMKVDRLNRGLFCQGYSNSNNTQRKEKSNDGLYFLPGSISEYYNENPKFRQNFDDILYLNNEINKKETHIEELRQSQIDQFRRKNGVNLSVMNEMIYAALFGNGISV